MRVTTRLTPKTCLAIWLAMMLRLSPCVAATNASARSMPARLQHFLVDAVAQDRGALEVGPRRLNADDLMSMIVTSWPAWVSISASRAPTRPQPMMMTNYSVAAAT